MTELPEETLRQIEIARALRQSKRRLEGIERKTSRAEEERDLALPEGRGNPSSRTFVAAHPLEFLAATLRKIRGGRDAERLERQRMGVEGAFDSDISEFDKARKLEDMAFLAKNSGVRRPSAVGGGSVVGTGAGSSESGGLLPIDQRGPRITGEAQKPPSWVPFVSNPFIQDMLNPDDLAHRNMGGGPFQVKTPQAAPGQVRRGSDGNLLKAFLRQAYLKETP